MCFKGRKQKPPRLSNSASSSPTTGPANTQGRSSFSFLLGPSSSSHQSLMLAPAPQSEGQPLSTIPLKPEPKQSLPSKRQHSSTEAQEETSLDEDFPIALQEESSTPKKGKTANWLTSMKSDRADAFSRDSDSVKEARACYFATHSWDWTHGNTEDLPTYSKNLPKRLAYWKSPFLKYNTHGKDQNI